MSYICIINNTETKGVGNGNYKILKWKMVKSETENQYLYPKYKMLKQLELASQRLLIYPMSPLIQGIKLKQIIIKSELRYVDKNGNI